MHRSQFFRFVTHFSGHLQRITMNLRRLLIISQWTVKNLLITVSSRGVNRNKLNLGESISVEEISKMAYDQCLAELTNPNSIESLTTRYSVLADSIKFTELLVKTNTTRVTSFLASALFYFGYAPEKLTPNGPSARRMHAK
ncbi:hypothetical protein KIN20_010240 [Parelaphostrongylus tenuis]|uniref:Uncharacterized protein n=1 Tax=Parelaphostrongylus tenuis TaxID=148309 RepID=A0AAD5MRN3_PARTN|nr:hypothetical protein KIN20_010240 [Parelaphostrongylus tenuis]